MGVAIKDATDEHFYKATALVLRDLMSQGYKEFNDKTVEQNKKTVYYLCMEFLLGRSLKNNICNLNLEQTIGDALKGLGADLDKIYEQEPDAGLGNGGLGRLAACFLDGLASQGYPSMGYSLRYEMGILGHHWHPKGRWGSDRWLSPTRRACRRRRYLCRAARLCTPDSHPSVGGR